MTSTSNTMLVTFWRANTSWATSRRNPLNPHCVSCTGPTTQTEASRWNALPRKRRHPGCACPHVGAIGLDPGAVGGIRCFERLQERDQLVRRGRHVGVGEHDQVAGRVEHPCANRGPLAAMGHRQQLELAVGVLRSGAHEVRGPVGGAVVDDEDVDRVRQLVGSGAPFARVIAASVEIAEQLVQRGSEASLLVVGGQDKRQCRLRHRRSLGPGAATCNRTAALAAPGTLGG